MKSFYYLIILSFFNLGLFSCENKALVQDYQINNYLENEFPAGEFVDKSSILLLNAEGCEPCVLQVLAYCLNNSEAISKAKIQLIIGGVPSTKDIEKLIAKLSLNFIADEENKLRDYYQGYFNGVIINLETGEHFDIVSYEDFEENSSHLFVPRQQPTSSARY